MTTLTPAAAARHDMEQALLSLFGSLATAATNGPATLGIIRMLDFRFCTHDRDGLEAVARQIINVPGCGVDMDGVKRHAQELREAVAIYRAAVGERRRRPTDEPAREHVRNAQMMFEALVIDGFVTNGEGYVEMAAAIRSRLQRALDEIMRGNP